MTTNSILSTFSNNIERMISSNLVNEKQFSLQFQELMGKQSILICRIKRLDFGCNDLGDLVQQLLGLYHLYVHSPSQRNNISSKFIALHSQECITLEKLQSLEELFNANIHVSNISLKMKSI